MTPDPVHRMVQRRAERFPDAVAIAEGDHRWTCRDLDAAADLWARRLCGYGAGLEARVALCLPPSVVLPAVLLGALRSGAAVVPLDPASSAFQLRMVIDDTEPCVVLADPLSGALFDRTRSRVLEVDVTGLGVEPTAPPVAAVPVPPSAAAAILYTSGSLDEPRPVVIEHAALASACTAGAEAGSRARAVPLAGAPTTVAALSSVLTALADGVPIRIPPRGEHIPATAADPGHSVVETVGMAPAAALTYVLDERLRPVPPGGIGELYVGGAGVTRGYLDQPAETSARYVADPFRGRAGCRMVATGKSARRELDGRLTLLRDAEPEAVPPGGPDAPRPAAPVGADVLDRTGRIVATVWAEVLGRAVGIDEGFFHAGGDSLLLVRLHELLSAELAQPIAFADLFQHTTVRALTDFLAGARRAGDISAGDARGRARRQAKPRAPRPA